MNSDVHCPPPLEGVIGPVIIFCEEYLCIGIGQIPIFELSRPKQDYNIPEYNIDYHNVMQSQLTEVSKATDQVSVIDKLVQFTTAL